MNGLRIFGFATILAASTISFTSCNDSFEEINKIENTSAQNYSTNKVVKAGPLDFIWNDWRIVGEFHLDLENRTLYVDIKATHTKKNIEINIRGTITWVKEDVTSFDGTVTDDKGNMLLEDDVKELYDILNACLDQVI